MLLSLTKTLLNMAGGFLLLLGTVGSGLLVIFLVDVRSKKNLFGDFPILTKNPSSTCIEKNCEEKQ